MPREQDHLTGCFQFVLESNICELLATKASFNVVFADGAGEPDAESVITGGQ